MKIGELAKIAQCSVETIRFYEKAGLLAAPARNAANFRLYSAEHVERLRFIRNCRALDMSHDEIHHLLRLADRPIEHCEEINAVFDQHIGHVAVRIQELEQLKVQLDALRLRCQANAHPCGILQGLAAMELSPKTEKSHLG